MPCLSLWAPIGPLAAFSSQTTCCMQPKLAPPSNDKLPAPVHPLLMCMQGWASKQHGYAAPASPPSNQTFCCLVICARLFTLQVTLQVTGVMPGELTDARTQPQNSAATSCTWQAHFPSIVAPHGAAGSDGNSDHGFHTGTDMKVIIALPCQHPWLVQSHPGQHAMDTPTKPGEGKCHLPQEPQWQVMGSAQAQVAGHPKAQWFKEPNFVCTDLT